MIALVQSHDKQNGKTFRKRIAWLKIAVLLQTCFLKTSFLGGGDKVTKYVKEKSDKKINELITYHTPFPLAFSVNYQYLQPNRKTRLYLFTKRSAFTASIL